MDPGQTGCVAIVAPGVEADGRNASRRPWTPSGPMKSSKASNASALEDLAVGLADGGDPRRRHHDLR